MYLMHIDFDLKVEGVSRRFKQLMSNPKHSLKNCFFLSMVDCETPDQLAEDLQDSLSKGIVYSALLKFNQALSQPRWFRASISFRYENGKSVGYLVRLEDPATEDLQGTLKIYSQVKEGDLFLERGFPVTKEWKLAHADDKSNDWLKRIK